MGVSIRFVNRLTAGNGEDLVKAYRGTDKGSEINAFEETGHLMSDATRNLYYESGNLKSAYKASESIHQKWLKLWGDENTFVQAHGEFGTEFSQSFKMERTLMSVTTDPNVAKYFAGPNGRVFEGLVPRSELSQQTIKGAGENEYLIKLGRGGFK